MGYPSIQNLPIKVIKWNSIKILKLNKYTCCCNRFKENIGTYLKVFIIIVRTHFHMWNYSVFYMALAINITDGCGLSNEAGFEFQFKNSKLMLYEPLILS